HHGLLLRSRLLYLEDVRAWQFVRSPRDCGQEPVRRRRRAADAVRGSGRVRKNSRPSSHIPAGTRVFPPMPPGPGPPASRPAGSCSATTRMRHAMTMLTVISPACSEVQSTHTRPSAIHLPGWLNMSQQRQIAEAFHEWSTGPLPIRATSLPGGHQMSVRTLRLGRHQQPSTRNASVPDGQRVTEVPGWLAYIGQAAISAIYGPLAAAAYRPDTVLVNYYDPGPRPWGGAVRSRLLMPYAAF